jgi:GH15 family glucan-1,4-alpha-glucosidase
VGRARWRPAEPRARYLPIAEHGLIGELHTVALVGTDGTIDWYCCPRFDSPSVFAAILMNPAKLSIRLSALKAISE